MRFKNLGQEFLDGLKLGPVAFLNEVLLILIEIKDAFRLKR